MMAVIFVLMMPVLHNIRGIKNLPYTVASV